MTRTCEICAKQQMRVWRRIKLRGKYNPTTKRTQKPNLQWLLVSEPIAAKLQFPAGTRVRACAKCIKAVGKSK